MRETRLIYTLLVLMFLFSVPLETHARTFLGAAVGYPPEEYIDSDSNPIRGAYIVKVFEKSPAADAGLQRGDLIVRFGEEPIESFSELVKYVQASKIGRRVRLRIIRALHTPPIDVDVKLGDMPDSLLTPPKLIKGSMDTNSIHYTYTDTFTIHVESPHIVVADNANARSTVRNSGSDIIVEVDGREIRIEKIGWFLQDRFENRPLPENEGDLLRRANLNAMPRSPFGGRWAYIKSPGHNTYTLHAFDTNDILKFTYHSSPITDPVFYDQFNSSPKIGRTKENLLWSAPWDSCALGWMTAQALREATNADIGLFNAYAMRGNIPKGIIRKMHIPHVYLWSDSVVVLGLKGTDLMAILARGTDQRWWLYTAGIKAEAKYVDLGIPEFTAKLENGELIESEKVYTVAVSTFLANGGDGFFSFKNAIYQKPDKLDLWRIMEDYFRRKFRS